MTTEADRRGNAPRIDAERLWRSLQCMAEIGATPRGGCDRQTLTEEDRAGRALFARWCADAGLTVEIDSMGSIFARRAGREADLAPVALGSHLDTQPAGGKYDGPLGVLAALEVVRALNDHGVETRRPIEIVNWTNEEGARFAPAMLASGVFAGLYDEAWAKALRDRNGVRFGDALRAIGQEGPVPVGGRPYHAFLELHIEQGPILEAEGVDIGVVVGGQGLRWLDVTVTGQSGHAGATPMGRRQDAMAAAARMISAVEAIAKAQDDRAVGTVGSLRVRPDSRNVVPGEVDFTVDLRHPDEAAVTALTDAFETQARAIAEAAGVEIAIAEVERFAPVQFDPHCLDALRDAADQLGLSRRDLISGAGHDAFCLARVAPSAMIFCPCVDGISHNEAEEILPEWAANGAATLLAAALTLADEA